VPSKARKAFDSNARNIERLIEIHGDVGGDEQGRRFGLEVLNKSAIVLITAIWEAYCEDIASEALEHLVANTSDASKLPKELKKTIASEVKADLHELAVWKLADTGWRDVARARLAALTIDRNFKLNTPKSNQIDGLFLDAIGLKEVSKTWKWKKMSAIKARAKLDRYITLRGEIAHRGDTASSVKKIDVTDYFQHVKRLVAKTGGEVNSHVKNATGKTLW
jgi:hypothetical protein